MNKTSNRRQFLFQVSAGGVAALSAQSLVTQAADIPAVDPSGPQAAATAEQRLEEDLKKID